MSARLESVSGERSLHPASKQIKLGLDAHTPVAALRELLTDEQVLSDALHELTHFHSLNGSIGATFSAWSFLYKLAVEDLSARINGSREGLDLALLRCLHLGMRMEEAEEVWRPLLEGLAVYAQTSAPCGCLETMIAPLETLGWFELWVDALDSTATGSGLPPSRIVQIGERCAGRGAALLVQDRLRLAEWIELSSDPRALPYFFGHAFVRALQTRLRRTTCDFDCAETFLSLMFRILHGSWDHLVGRRGESIRHPQEAIARLYALPLDVFEQARPADVRRLLDPDFDVNVMTWLELGKAVPPEPWDEHVLTSALRDWFSAEWDLFKSTTADRTGLLRRALQSAILQTQVLNMTSGGTCSVVGFVPTADGGAHACALNVDGATWWLIADDESLMKLGIRPAELIRLPIGAMQAGTRIPEQSQTVTLRMSSFLRQRKRQVGDREEVTWDLDVLLVGHEGDGIAATADRSAARGHRGAVLRAQVNSVLDLRGTLRELLETPLDCLGLAGWLDREGIETLAISTRENWAAHCRRQALRRERVHEKILEGLLSRTANAEDVMATLVRERMGLIDNQLLRDSIVSSYAAPVVMTGPGAAGRAEFLEAINLISRKKLGGPAFEVVKHPGRGAVVRYLGIWERPA